MLAMLCNSCLAISGFVLGCIKICAKLDHLPAPWSFKSSIKPFPWSILLMIFSICLATSGFVFWSVKICAKLDHLPAPWSFKSSINLSPPLSMFAMQPSISSAISGPAYLGTKIGPPFISWSVKIFTKLDIPSTPWSFKSSIKPFPWSILLMIFSI